MNYEIVNLEEMILVGISKKTSNHDGQCITEIGEVWQKFLGEGVYRNINNCVSKESFGVYSNYEGPMNMSYTFMAGVKVSQSNNPELTTVEIPAGKYAKFTIQGDVIKDVGKAWQEIWPMNLDRTFLYDFEMYHNNSDDMTNQTIDILIGIK